MHGVTVFRRLYRRCTHSHHDNRRCVCERPRPAVGRTASFRLRSPTTPITQPERLLLHAARGTLEQRRAPPATPVPQVEMSAPHGSTTKLLSRTRLNVGHFLLPLHQVLSMRVLQRRQQRGHLRLHAALQPSARPCEVVEHPHVLHCLEVLLQVLLVSPPGSARWPPKRQLVGGACPSRGTVHTRLATRVSSMLRAATERAAEKRRLGAQHKINSK